MKFLTFSPTPQAAPRPGILVGETVLALPYSDMLGLVEAGDDGLELARSLARQSPPAYLGMDAQRAIWSIQEITLQAPITRPPAFRDFYAFEEHVTTANANRGREVPKEWYQFPAFYFSNPTAISGPDEAVAPPEGSQALDFELEAACIVGKPGRDIPPERAMEHIFGFSVLNDWSARDIQKQEMRIGLGPAKGKDFATSIGPWIVTPDELAPRHAGRPGVYDLAMSARVNGEERSRGNWKDIYYSFGEIIQRASAGVTLFPGEVIGSGTVGTGCLLELTRGQGPWLQPGDVVELEIEQIGVLRNRVSWA